MKAHLSAQYKIPFNKPFLTGKELFYLKQSMDSGKLSGDGAFTKKCHAFFQKVYGFQKVLLTPSCTAALEMAAILTNISLGDEVIIPSFTFPSTATAFALRGANILFADSSSDSPNIDADQIEPLITKKTKAIVVVHYAGVACDMEKILELTKRYNLYLIEDAAHAIDSYYKGVPLGKIGHLGAFSFHETKNVSSGEGGLIAINHVPFSSRAEIIREKGTNRSAFFRDEVDKYGWVDIGSSFLPSDMTAAFLLAQLEELKNIQKKRVWVWEQYYERLKILRDRNLIQLPTLPPYATNNGHLFYLLCGSLDERQALIQYLKINGVMAVFHYQSLHASEYYKRRHDGRHLPNTERYNDCLLRLPLYCGLSEEAIEYIVEKIKEFYG